MTGAKTQLEGRAAVFQRCSFVCRIHEFWDHHGMAVSIYCLAEYDAV